MNIQCEVSRKLLDSHEFISHFQNQEHGAQVFFFGVVRKKNHGKDVISIRYDAFEPLVIQSFQEIAKEALAMIADDTAQVRIAHRLDEIKVGENSIAIGVGTKHRKEAYLVNQYIIEEIKKRSPIWKKEAYVTGESEWVKGHALCAH